MMATSIVQLAVISISKAVAYRGTSTALLILRKFTMFRVGKIFVFIIFLGMSLISCGENYYPEPTSPNKQISIGNSTSVINSELPNKTSSLQMITPLALATPVPEKWDKSWLTNNLCKLPCWENITVGKTTVDDAIGILQYNPTIKTLQINTKTGLKDGVLSWTFIDNKGSGEARFSLQGKHSIIFNIIIWYKNPTTLEQVITAIKEPSHISVAAVRNPNNTDSYYIDVVYSHLGFMASHSGSKQLNIDASLGLSNFQIFEPGLSNLEKLLGSG
jgi:hypothetical protein